MAVAPVAEVVSSAVVRYEALIRISNSIRARKEPQDLFDILVHELSQVVPFDAIAQFDESANKVYWHLCSTCLHHDENCPSEDENGETLPRLVYRTQETVVLGTLEGETLYPAFSRKMRANGLHSLCAFPLTTAHR